MRLAIQPPPFGSDVPSATLDTDAQLFAEALEDFGILRGNDVDLGDLARWITANLGLRGVKTLEATLAGLLQIEPSHLARDHRSSSTPPPPDAILGGIGDEEWRVPIGGFATSALRMHLRQIRYDAEIMAYPENHDFSDLLDNVFRPLASASKEIVYIDRFIGHELIGVSPLRCRPRLEQVCAFLFELVDAADDGCQLELMTSFEDCHNRDQVTEVAETITNYITEAASTRTWRTKDAAIAIHATKNKMAVPHDRRFRFGRTVLNVSSGHEVLPGGSNRTTMAGILPTRAWMESCREECTFRALDTVVSPPPIPLG